VSHPIFESQRATDPALAEGVGFELSLATNFRAIRFGKK
jgi:hypothetical protein